VLLNGAGDPAVLRSKHSLLDFFYKTKKPEMNQIFSAP